MIFFITGASSFIGVELCRYLISNGHQVIAMSRQKNELLNAIAVGGQLQVFYADMYNLIEKVRNFKADVFIHLAWAGTSHKERNNLSIQEENVRLSLECVKLSEQMGCCLYVDAGSQAEYGIVSGILTEETECNPFSAYGKAKLQLYYKTCNLTNKIGLKYIHLRILSVYGENDHPDSLIMSSLRKLKNNAPIVMSSGDQKWNYVYVKDAVRQIAELALYAIVVDTFRCEVYNIASEDTRVLREFVVSMKEVSGSKSELFFGGYDKKKDVNLEPNVKKTKSIVVPLTTNYFENSIQKMINLTTYNRIL